MPTPLDAHREPDLSAVGAEPLVAAADAEGQQRQVEGRRAGGQGHGVRGTGVAADLLLEGLEVGAGGAIQLVRKASWMMSSSRPHMWCTSPPA